MAVADEPYYFDAHKQLAYRELFGGRAEAAKKRMADFLKVHPNRVGPLSVAGETELFGGDPKKAQKLFERVVEVSQGENVYARLRLGDLLSRSGEQRQAELHLSFVDDACRRRIEEGNESWFNFWALAVSAAVRGEKEEALDWLEKAVDRGRLHYGFDRREPSFECLREEARFLRLVEQMRTKTEKLRQRITAMVDRGELRLTPEGR
jgi:tetratricopeptide (TPR) repeat protein